MEINYKLDRQGKVWSYSEYRIHHMHIFKIETIDEMWNRLQKVTVEVYDSKADTLEHIKNVNKFLLNSINELIKRAQLHDDSKLTGIEKELFDKYTPILKDLTYESDEYKKSLEMLKPALDNHYKENSHHPEHYVNGIDGMDLFDIIEMLNDWKAATLRQTTGDIYKSLEINKKRFNISDQLYNILKNTIDKYDWL